MNAFQRIFQDLLGNVSLIELHEWYLHGGSDRQLTRTAFLKMDTVTTGIFISPDIFSGTNRFTDTHFDGFFRLTRSGPGTNPRFLGTAPEAGFSMEK